jgi:hypothetical protein
MEMHIIKNRETLHAAVKKETVAMQDENNKPLGSTNVQNKVWSLNVTVFHTTVIICIRWPKLRVGEVSIEALRVELLL